MGLRGWRLPDWRSLGLDLPFLTGDGETHRLIRAFDWTASDLGPPGTWPAALKTAIELMLGARQPVYVAWGHKLTSFYNDGYLPIVGDKHPAIGMPFTELWREIWDEFQPIVDATMAGEAQYFIDLPIALSGRPGVPIGYFIFSYTPLRDEAGQVAGFYCAATETTDKVLAEQHRAFQLEIEECLQRAPDAASAIAAGAGLIGGRLGAAQASFAEVATDGWIQVIAETTDGTLPPLLGQRLRFEDFGKGSADSLRDGQTTVVANVHTDSRFEHEREAFRQLGVSSHITTPILRNGGLAACLYLTTAAPRNWTEHEINLAKEAAERTWNAVDRARAAEVLRIREARLATLFEQAPTFMALLSGPDHLFEIANPRYIELVGGRQVVGKTIAQALPEAAEQGYIDILDQIFRTGEAYTATSARWAVDGPDGGPPVERLLDFVYQPITDSQGAVTGIFVEGFEVTSQARAQVHIAGLAALGERFRHAVEPGDFAAAAGAIIGQTLGVSRGGYATIDKAAETVTIERDWNAPGIISIAGTLSFRDFGSYIDDLKRDETVTIQDVRLDPRTQPTHEALEGISARAFVNMPIIEADGLVALVFANHAEPRVWAPDELAFIADVGQRTRSVVERRRAEQGLRDLAASLEREVETRTRELVQTQDALRQSQKLEAMGQLTGGVAHDFNNLLTPIIGGLDMLQRRGVGDERERRMIDGALQSADRAKTLVQRLLAFARRQPLQAKPVDIAALVSGMQQLVSSTLGPQVSVKIDAPADLPAARADANQVEMAILNLSVNARDAMPAGGRLRVAASLRTSSPDQTPGLAPGHYVCLAITDNGIGMDAETRLRAVEPFFSTKGVGKGTGLGLSMVHGLALQLEGGLFIESQPGLGTTVSLWLPVAEERAQAAGQPDEKVDSPETACGVALVVDDEPLVRASTADMLQDLGYHVVELGSAEEALCAIDEGLAPAIVVTDHLMHGMTGAELSVRLKTRLPGTPVLIASGYAEADGLAKDLPRLTKPFRSADLAKALAALDGAVKA